MKVSNKPARGERSEEIRHFILSNVDAHPGDIAQLAAAKFEISRQASNKHLRRLIEEGALTAVGKTRERTYRLVSLARWSKVYAIAPGLEEDQVWREDVSGIIGPLARNVLGIWDYCFTEMFNNAIDHSAGTEILVEIAKTAANTEILIRDDGIGIFRKIQSAMNLPDERQAILELAKGKLTTDPEKHSGQGIFFTSRLVDSFNIFSGGVHFMHEFAEPKDWIVESSTDNKGTAVLMKLGNHSARTAKSIFDQYSSGDDYGFTKTVVPVRLAQYGEDRLISRSQAKRLLTRVDRFKSVWFDFAGVETIGQAFADEIFRVYARSHPEMEIVPINANSEVQQMIQAAILHE